MTRWHGFSIGTSVGKITLMHFGRFGSNSEVTASPRHVRFPPGSGHPSVPSAVGGGTLRTILLRAGSATKAEAAFRTENRSHRCNTKKSATE